MKARALSLAIYALGTGIGVLAFIAPFMSASTQGRAGDAPLMLSALVGLCFIVLLFETQGQAVNTKFIALLGVLVSMNSVLRFLEVAIPGPGGFSPIFFLIVLTGYVFGGRFGFLMGALTLMVSALITGSMGPWLPHQMFTASWVGMSAPLCRLVVKPSMPRREIIVLAVFAGFWGLAYGAIINVSFWSYASGSADQYWEPGIGLTDTLSRYGTFYLATSLAWDSLRAVGNTLLVLALGAPTLRALRRFQRRFAFSYHPAQGET